ncbi:hypothetical protein GCM10011416_04420 [Polaribacter pacificus]|uniref:Uncharacterized protein n=2 Tax=Polaribacter pacificus TaxID=1775173 RepID=A0A917HVP7_9FLAO|nr:hypothetical protein GCM10011416_04420 [Polaribacter pacificus]
MPKNDSFLDTTEIISLLYNKISEQEAKFSAFPPEPPVFPIKKKLDFDIKIDTNKILNALLRKRGKSIVAIDTVLKGAQLDNTLDIKDIEYADILKKLISTDNIENIDPLKIKASKYSLIIPFTGDSRQLRNKETKKKTFFLRFSKIAYNEELNKAIVKMSVSFSKLNGFSSLFFMKKENDKWVIKHEKNLTII